MRNFIDRAWVDLVGWFVFALMLHLSLILGICDISQNIIDCIFLCI